MLLPEVNVGQVMMTAAAHRLLSQVLVTVEFGVQSRDIDMAVSDMIW